MQLDAGIKKVPESDAIHPLHYFLTEIIINGWFVWREKLSFG